MLRNLFGFALVVACLSIAALAAASSDSAQQSSLKNLTQDQAALYLACIEESSAGGAKDGNPLAALATLNMLWSKTVKQTSLKPLSMLQLVQVTDGAVRALAAQEFGNASLTGKVFKQFSNQTTGECLSIAQSLHQ